MNLIKYNCLLLFIFILLVVFFVTSGFPQIGDYVYYKNFVHHSSGELCEHTPPNVTFTVFLNRDQSKILIENAPRWNLTGDPNIDGKGTFGVELGNFSDPDLQVGDSVFIRFTCNATLEQGLLEDSVTSIPWLRWPSHLYLSHVDLPSPPQNVNLTVDDNNHRIISWTQEPGITYRVYRRTIQDTIHTGKSRMLYEQIADNLSTGSFTDITALENRNYGYIIYAISDEGVISSHSEEATKSGRISNLTGNPRVTTVLLKWRSYSSPFEEIKGYNIYRRTENKSYGDPIGYTGLDTIYIDSRLNPGTKYYYKIKARVDYRTELGESEEIAVTTLPSQDGWYTYTNLKVAVVIYTNTNGGGITSKEVEKIHIMLDVGKLFYWRNSGMKLNVEFTYFSIDGYRNFGDPNDTNVKQTVDDLKALGVINTQYDIIFRISPATNGYWSYGVINLDFPGPQRATGFSHSHWPAWTGVKYPGYLSDINYNLTWLFVHEVQHAIDAIYEVNGHPEMYHGDLPWQFPVACGEHYDFQAKIFRTFKYYEDLSANWGDIYEAVDADNDGFPDAEPLVALDEMRFASSPELEDTDSDGYTDKQEATDGTYSGSNPTHQDTDNDGIADGEDVYPRYPVNQTVKYFTPKIDGVIEVEWPMVNDTVSYTQVGYSPILYMSYDDDSLYLAVYLENFGIPELFFDFHGDGWWFSSGNTYMKINPSKGNFSEFRSWDASPEVQKYSESIGESPAGMWDTDPKYQEHFLRRVIDPRTVNLKVIVDFPVTQIEMAIPKNKYAGITLKPGDKIGLNIKYTKVNNQSDQWASTFDLYSFAYFELGRGTYVKQDGIITGVIDRFSLSQNYPNPFNTKTGIKYEVPEAGYLEFVIYNILGEHIRTLVDGYNQPGTYEVIWNGKNDSGQPVSSGIYFYKLKASNGLSIIRKMILIK